MGESASHLIFFTSSLIVATGIALLIGANALSIAQSMQDNSMILSERYRSSITIINDPENTFNNIYVKNTGKTILNGELIDIFVDGVFTQVNSSSTEGSSYWTEGVVLNISMPLPAGKHSVRVVVENGVSDTFVYKK